MQFFLKRISALLIVLAAFSVQKATAQEDTIPTTSVDPRVLEWEDPRQPREYTIAAVDVVGLQHLDSSIVLSISGIQVGDKFTHPGGDLFAKAINNLWRQKLFSDIEIYVTKIEGDKVTIIK